MVLYEKTPAVDQDWQDIAEYTFENFGEDQLRKYTRNLNKCLENMANNKGHFKEIAIQKNRLRIMRCQKHYVFAIIKIAKPMLVIAIFHERMDLMQRVKKRLK